MAVGSEQALINHLKSDQSQPSRAGFRSKVILPSKGSRIAAVLRVNEHCPPGFRRKASRISQPTDGSVDKSTLFSVGAMMKPRIGVYLSKRTAARLTTAAKRRRTTKSALVEAAIGHFLDSDDAHDAVTLTDRITELSGQIGQLDRDLGIVSEIVALHARFHLAVTPELPAAKQPGACKLGSARFDEFATQVERRLQRGSSLMQETIDRLGTGRRGPCAGEAGERPQPPTIAIARAPEFSALSRLDEMPEDTAAVREDGSTRNFPTRQRSPLH
jgi:hypothetical protein